MGLETILEHIVNVVKEDKLPNCYISEFLEDSMPDLIETDDELNFFDAVTAFANINAKIVGRKKIVSERVTMKTGESTSRSWREVIELLWEKRIMKEPHSCISCEENSQTLERTKE